MKYVKFKVIVIIITIFFSNLCLVKAQSSELSISSDSNPSGDNNAFDAGEDLYFEWKDKGNISAELKILKGDDLIKTLNMKLKSDTWKCTWEPREDYVGVYEVKLFVDGSNNSTASEKLLLIGETSGDVPTWFWASIYYGILFLVISALGVIFLVIRSKKKPKITKPNETNSLIPNEPRSISTAKYCKSCGKPYVEGSAQFCTNCGVKLR